MVLGLAILGSSESMLEMQNLRPHSYFLSQNLHLNMFLGNTGHSQFQDVLLLVFRKTKLHHNRSQQNKQTKKITQQSKIQKTQEKGNGGHYEVQHLALVLVGSPWSSGLALIRSWSHFHLVTTLPPLLFSCAIGRQNSMQLFIIYLLGWRCCDHMQVI